MSSTDEKLIQLAETKSNIRDAIISKGVEVDTSLPFNQYADKIGEISGSERGEIINFDITGSPEINYGLATFSSGNYLYNTWNDCTQDVIIHLKFKTPSTLSGDTVIASCDRNYNFDLNASKFTVWSWKYSTEYLKMTPAVNRWYYVCIKITNEAEDAHKQVYVSTIGFSTDNADLKADYYDYKGTSDKSGFIGCDAAIKRPWRGTVDLNQCYVTDHSGNMIKRLYAVSTIGD